MGITINVQVHGAWVVQPKTPHEAQDQGWHRALEYETAFNITSEFPYQDFKAWCKNTFEHGTYAIFVRNAWFLHEQDCTLAKLRWS